MIGLIFSIDYEIYGSGTGDAYELMVKPTQKLLDLFNEYDAKLTIMAEVGEILAFKHDVSFHSVYKKIEEQLSKALMKGHDVQLHIHPAWFKARYEDGIWHLNFNEYSLTDLPDQIITQYVRQGKKYLEHVGQGAVSGYNCIAFRAGNWIMQPSHNIIKVLENEGFLYDTSVFKYGYGQVGKYKIDYRNAPSNIFPWVVSSDEIAASGRRNGLIEIPILSRKVFISQMLTLKRLKIHRALVKGCKDNNQTEHNNHSMGSGKSMGGIKLYHPKKFDFCRLNFREMKNYLLYALSETRRSEALIPIIAIGHSTEYRPNSDLRRFLKFVSGLNDVEWFTFNDLAKSSYAPMSTPMNVF